MKVSVSREPNTGLVAVLDALGASDYGDQEIVRFLESRRFVLEALNQKAEQHLGVDATRVTTFTFNDTIVIAYCSPSAPSVEDVQSFFTILRKFLVDSMSHQILFRGAVSIGSFYLDEATNTIMGPAVTDAAAWYEAFDWIGAAVTPEGTLYIESLLSQTKSSLDNALLRYNVPLKRGETISLFCVNWPKAFFLRNITPCRDDEDPRAKCLSLFVRNGVPKGTEEKYFNSVKFFDHSNEVRRENKKSSNAPRR